jgi:hypothetical protein
MSTYKIYSPGRLGSGDFCTILWALSYTALPLTPHLSCVSVTLSPENGERTCPSNLILVIVFYFIVNADGGKFQRKNDVKCDRSILSSECHIICYYFVSLTAHLGINLVKTNLTYNIFVL